MSNYIYKSDLGGYDPDLFYPNKDIDVELLKYAIDVLWTMNDKGATKEEIKNTLKYMMVVANNGDYIRAGNDFGINKLYSKYFYEQNK